MAKLSACMTPAELLDACLIKSLDVDDMNAIENDVRGCGKYTDGFMAVLNSRKEVK